MEKRSSKLVYARNLRKQQTEAEKRLWYHFRNRHFQGVKFRRQYIIEPYIVDFVCLEKKLVIEIDGSQHAENLCYDTSRTNFLNSKGYHVMRFWNNEVLMQTEAVLESILSALDSFHPHPVPLPQAGEGTPFSLLVI